MGDLGADTAVTAVGDGVYRAELREDWNIWGPNGGYLAAVALRAAGAACSVEGGRPAGLQCHFLGVARFEPVTLTVVALRSSRRAEALRVSMAQDGGPVVEALVWAVAGGLPGMEHVGASMPDVPGWQGLPLLADVAGAGLPMHRFRENVDERWISEWIPIETRAAAAPAFQNWVRFKPTATFDDPWVDGGRLAVLVDTFQWPAAVRGHDGWSLEWSAPSLDLTVQFHSDASGDEWLLVDALSPVAGGGLVAGTSRVWAPDGRLVASGSQQMLCRPTRPSDMPRQVGDSGHGRNDRH